MKFFQMKNEQMFTIEHVYKRICSIYARAIYLLHCTLDSIKFNQISTYRMTKKIWKALEVTHKGINQVKETNINIGAYLWDI